MTQVRLKGDTVFISDIDVHRVARRCLKLNLFQSQPKDIGQSLDLVAQMLGFPSYHGMRSQARQHQVDQGMEPYLQLQRQALTQARAFPSELPERFNKEWQKKSVEIFNQALAARDQKRVEIITVVGSSGSGKTLLAQNMVKQFGGVIWDATVYRSSIDISKLRPNNLVIYDRPAELPQGKENYAAMQQMLSNINCLIERSRRNFNPFDIFGLYSQVLDHAKNYNGIPVVVVLPDMSDVGSLLRSILYPGIGEPGELAFQAAHVVNLDTMKMTTVLASLK